ncbi:hypothetical protein D9M68_629640 [compost metagenome]
MAVHDRLAPRWAAFRQCPRAPSFETSKTLSSRVQITVALNIVSTMSCSVIDRRRLTTSFWPTAVLRREATARLISKGKSGSLDDALHKLRIREFWWGQLLRAVRSQAPKHLFELRSRTGSHRVLLQCLRRARGQIAESVVHCSHSIHPAPTRRAHPCRACGHASPRSDCGRAQDHHSLVRRHGGLDRLDPRPGSGGGPPPDHPCHRDDDGGRALLRGVRRQVVGGRDPGAVRRTHRP